MRSTGLVNYRMLVGIEEKIHQQPQDSGYESTDQTPKRIMSSDRQHTGSVHSINDLITFNPKKHLKYARKFKGQMYESEKYEEITSYNCYENLSGQDFIHISLVDYLEQYDTGKVVEDCLAINKGQYYVPQPNLYADKFRGWIEKNVFGK